MVQKIELWRIMQDMSVIGFGDKTAAPHRELRHFRLNEKTTP